ncbi:MAG: hypothetical protein H7289_10225 [Mucilaginibacter sp.]|nr:hypothetical protein [Mucilaginibacter sp.]
MKNICLSILVLVCLFGCKKNDGTITDTTPAKKNFVVQISSAQKFDYYITETDPVTNDFYTKEDVDVTSINYSFVPKPGHTVTVEAISTPTATFTTSLTYNGTALSPIVPVKDSNHTSFIFNYSIPK